MSYRTFCQLFSFYFGDVVLNGPAHRKISLVQNSFPLYTEYDNQVLGVKILLIGEHYVNLFFKIIMEFCVKNYITHEPAKNCGGQMAAKWSFANPYALKLIIHLCICNERKIYGFYTYNQHL